MSWRKIKINMQSDNGSSTASAKAAKHWAASCDPSRSLAAATSECPWSGVLDQECLARSFLPGVFSQESSTKLFGVPRWSHHFSPNSVYTDGVLTVR